MATVSTKDREVLCDVLTEAGRRGGDGAIPIAAYREGIEDRAARDLASVVASKDAVIDALKARVAELELQVEQWRHICDDRQDRGNEWLARAEKAEAEVERLQGEIRLITAPIEAGGGIVAQLKAENERWIALVTKREAERDEVRAELATINESRSPCGHWAAHAITADGGKHITCLECEVERLRGDLSTRCACAVEGDGLTGRFIHICQLHAEYIGRQMAGADTERDEARAEREAMKLAALLENERLTNERDEARAQAEANAAEAQKWERIAKDSQARENRLLELIASPDRTEPERSGS